MATRRFTVSVVPTFAASAKLEVVLTAPVTALSQIQLVMLALVIAIVVLAGLARRLSISYPIVLVLAGLASSFIPGVPRVPLPPEVVFLIFLPPLIFASAWQVSWHDFRHNLVSISMLAIGLVAFTVLGISLCVHFFLPSFDWRLGFLLGAIISPTDAVAASSIASKIGMPKRIVNLIESESLINDATGLLALEFGLDIILHGSTPTLGAGLLRMLWLLGGGIMVGLAVGYMIAWFEKWIDDGPVEIAISLITAYGAYLAGEAVHASGIIAVVVCGLVLSRKSSTFFSPAVRLQAGAVWEALEFLLNGLVFILIGLQLPYVLAGLGEYTHLRLFAYGAGLSAILIALRLLWMYPAAAISYKIRKHILRQTDPPPEPRGIFVIGWTGMRGVVALAAASSLPYTLANGTPFVQRNLIVFLTFCVILVTLVLQGLSLPWVVRKLGIVQNGNADCEEGEARRILIRTAMEHLERCRIGEDHGLQHAYEDLLHQYEHRLESIVDCGPGMPAEDRHARSMITVMLETVQAEREELIHLRETGRVDDAIYRTLERELDLSESRLAPNA